MTKGRFIVGNPGPRKTHCVRGHELTTENIRVYITPAGYECRYCKLCDGIRGIKYRLSDKGKLNNRAKHLRLRFKMTLEEYDKKLSKQGGCCAICKRDVTYSRWGVFAIDHDHSCCKGKRSCGKCVRGLLCAMCNEFLGNAEDNVDRLLSAVEYLRKWKDSREHEVFNCDQKLL